MHLELKYPFTWEDRKPVYEDGVFFLPKHYDDHSADFLPNLHSEIFKNNNPIYIEYCSGNGSWLLDLAAATPQINWIAVEQRLDRARKIWSKTKKNGIKNVLVVLGEGLCFTRNYLKQGSIQEIFVNFPDPWPKDRHAKHRIITPEFLTEVARISAKNAKITMVTDDEPYSGQMREVALDHPNWTSCIPAPYYTNKMEGYGTSYFQQLWESKGKSIFYHQFQINQEIGNE